jgi:hypothetical protein
MLVIVFYVFIADIFFSSWNEIGIAFGFGFIIHTYCYISNIGLVLHIIAVHTKSLNIAQLLCNYQYSIIKQ